jgi:hypothetical protein
MSKRSLMLSLVAVALVVGCAEQKGRKKDDKKADKADKQADKSAAKQE